jgi:NTE family protein
VPKADLVLEGGGVKGIGLVGAIAVLEERGYRFHRVAGTSAGAIVGSLVAAGMKTEQMQQVMRSVDYTRFADPNLLDLFGPSGQALSVLFHNGIYRGDYLRGWLNEQLADCGADGVRTFDDLALDDPGSSLPPDRSYKLVVMASNVSDNCLARLPWDYQKMGAEPGRQSVVDAVRMSMSIPFFYQPFKYRGRCFVDGGMLSNFPIDVFDRTDGRLPRWPTFGIKLSGKPPAEGSHPAGVGGPLGLVKAMVTTMTNFHDRLHLDDPAVVDRTIFVDCGHVQATDFGLDEASQEMLYENGRRAAEKFLQNWDFDTYIRTYRSAKPTKVKAVRARAERRSQRPSPLVSR